MFGYHGTASSIAALLATGSIDVTKGGGELGRGFYTAENIWTAKAWAFGCYGDREKNVVRFDVPDAKLFALNIAAYERRATNRIRDIIRRTGRERTHLFGRDMIWSPIVGKESIYADQYKWESATSEALLNGPEVAKKVQ